MRSPYLTARELADLLELNVDTVYDLVARHQIPATRIGNQWRFDQEGKCVSFRQDRNDGGRE